MSHQSEAIAKTLQELADARLSPSLIDTAHQTGRIVGSQMVMTSLGNASRALITPYYPDIQFNNSIFDRVDAAVHAGHPFAEASIRVTGEDLRKPTKARVVIRFCEQAQQSGEIIVAETACAFDLADTSQYGTTERVIDEIYRNRNQGKLAHSSAGHIAVPPSEKRGKYGKWRLRPIDASKVVKEIRSGINEIQFTKPLDFTK